MAIGDLKQRLRNKFSRRNSTASSSKSTEYDTHHSSKPATIRSVRSKKPASTLGANTVDEEKELSLGGGVALGSALEGHLDPAAAPKKTLALPDQEKSSSKHDSTSTDFPTPNTDIPFLPEEQHEEQHEEHHGGEVNFGDVSYLPATSAEEKAPRRPGELQRRQSLLPQGQTRLIKTLLETELPNRTGAANLDYFTTNGPSTISGNMVSRKIWVKRPGASATLVTINEDDLVDDVRDMILKKYANSLGRSFDSPDVTLRIVPREQRQERTLGPEEPMGRTLDAYFPGGQTVDEALVIDVPLRRTPKPSPHTSRGYYEDGLRPSEAASEYFPPMPVTVAAPPSPHLQNTLPVNLPNHSHASLQHSMSVLTTGHVPALPSPGAGARRPHHNHGPNRPRIGRQHTSSPTIISNHPSQQVTNNGTHTFSRSTHPRTHSNASDKSNAPPLAPPLPTPPAPSLQQEISSQVVRVATPPPRASTPRPTNRPKRKKANGDHPSLPAGMLNGAVPPIKVLIVEDNIINLKLLEAFMKRLKVRWQTATNGKDAVTKWRAGGFHLVLMDIQLPIMSGLEATKEIRRLERLNNIGVFSSSASISAPSVEEGRELDGEDRLPTNVHFKSPVIIVALTASSLQTDRHEALAAGCNDFLTKPVNFVWLERKVMEWGCMQALIDFDGWRKWKDFSQVQALEDGKNGGGGGGGKPGGGGWAKKKKNRTSVGSSSGLGMGNREVGMVA
ncbi:CheY-like protein [Glarea lozoyensis ATCC 20868]|uniref:CheY-like protein n=1 Tax=Glarea lozoyensis (strain ATCC 20868 / MF5171) TaxID=1116229 RepID=S3DV61_GLAL2|nr:CheY-like protein [Glarea lozoyensis ATCC 20868]EPE35806.1 CheY-like protein [Glarea lozoyensis ATCC 20868]